MPLQNFIARRLPAISAAWLNVVDALKFTVFDDATTKATATTALFNNQAQQLHGLNTLLADNTNKRSARTLLELDSATVFNATDSSAVANTVTLTATGLALAPTIAVGTKINFTGAVLNTGAVTITLNGGAAAALINQQGNACTGGELFFPLTAAWTGAAWKIVAGSIPPTLARSAAETAAAVTPVDYSQSIGHVERYLTWVSAATDFTVAFQRAASVARNQPGLVIQFTMNRTYATTALGGATLFDLQNARSVVVYGNNALISAGNVNAGILDIFDINSAQDIKIFSLRYQQTYLTLDSVNGARFFRIRNSSSRILIVDCTQLGGNTGITCIGDPTTGTGRSDQVTALNCYFETVYYPQSFQASGDQYFARGIKTINCGRSYFPWNVRQHDVEMYSQQGGPFDDCLIAVYADPGSVYNKIEQIKLVYHSTGKYLTGQNQSADAAVVAIVLNQNTAVSTPAEVDSIDVRVEFEALVTPTSSKLFTIRKFNSAGNPDPTGRSYVLSNIKFGGKVKSWQNATGAACVDLFSTTGGEAWVGDSAYNIAVEDFWAQGDIGQNGININGQPYGAGRGVALRRVFTEMQIGRANCNEQQEFVGEQVVSSSIICGGYAAYTPTITGSTGNPVLGDGVVAGRWRRMGDWVDGYVELTIGSTTSGGTGNIRFSLPTTAAVGEGDQILGGVLLFDSGTRFYTGVPFIAPGTAYVEMYADQGAVTFATPFAYANGDKYRVSFRYLSTSA